MSDMTTKATGRHQATSDELAPEYRLDYRQARPNRFAGVVTDGQVIIVLDPDVAAFFHDSPSVNEALRDLIQHMPRAT